jgi:hypothetical protein
MPHFIRVRTVFSPILFGRSSRIHMMRAHQCREAGSSSFGSGFLEENAAFRLTVPNANVYSRCQFRCTASRAIEDDALSEEVPEYPRLLGLELIRRSVANNVERPVVFNVEVDTDSAQERKSSLDEGL